MVALPRNHDLHKFEPTLLRMLPRKLFGQFIFEKILYNFSLYVFMKKIHLALLPHNTLGYNDLKNHESRLPEIAYTS